MFLMILVTCLVTLLALIISSALYLVSLICSESDDPDADTLAIDTRDFTVTTSPLDFISNHHCENTNHHHLCHDLAEHSKYINGESPPSPERRLSKKDSTQSKSLPVEKPSLKSNDQAQYKKQIIDAQTSTWSTTVAAQKTMITNQLGATVSKQIFDDFDLREMQLGGTGLHWSKTRKSIDRLIRIGLPLNITNKRQETALHVAVRKKKLPVLIGLLGHGARVDSRNEDGETALLLACKVNDIFACQLLLVFDADVNLTDKYGLSPRHYSAAICDKHRVQPHSNQPNAAHLILAMLNELNAKRCPPHIHLKSHDLDVARVKAIQSPCVDGCSSSGTYNGNSYNRWPDYKKESLYKRHMFSDIIESKLREPANQRNKTLSRLLCIDGGGMRGVIVCQIMIEMEKYLMKPMATYFDWIGGTSVGAFLACALCTGTTLRHLRRISFDVKDEVFNGTKPYKTKFLERVLKRTFGATTRFSDVKDKKLAVTTVIADRDPCQLRIFKNYKSAADLLEQYGYSAEMFDVMSGHSIVTQKQSVTTSSKISATPSSGQSIISKSNTSLSSSGNHTIAKSHKEVARQAPVNTNRPIAQMTINTNRVAKQTNSQARQPSINDDDDVSLQEEDPKERAKDAKNDTPPTLETVLDESEQDPIMWQAVRASGAAPFFFKPYGPYLDGGIISNNPTLDMLAEFYAYERIKSFLRNRIHERPRRIKDLPIGGKNDLNVHEEMPGELNLVVSLGTGRGRVVGQQAMIDFGTVASGLATVFSPVELLRSIRAARDLFKKLMHRSCMTDDHILDRAQAWCSSLNIPYFRINPPLASIFSIDDKRDEQLINALWQTKLYMRSMDPQLKQLAALLDKETTDN